MTPGKLASRYGKEVRRAFGLWPTWLPDSSIRIGDFGYLVGGVFVPEGTVDGLQFRESTIRRRELNDHFFASRSVTYAVIGSEAGTSFYSAAEAKIDFEAAFGVIVALRGCKERRLSDSSVVARLLEDMAASHRWKHDYLVVTGVVESRSALVAVASRRGACLELAVSGPGSDLLAQLDGEVRVVRESNLGYRAVIRGDCTPLFRLSKLVSGAGMVLRGASERDNAVLEEVDARLTLGDKDAATRPLR